MSPYSSLQKYFLTKNGTKIFLCLPPRLFDFVKKNNLRMKLVYFRGKQGRMPEIFEIAKSGSFESILISIVIAMLLLYPSGSCVGENLYQRWEYSLVILMLRSLNPNFPRRGKAELPILLIRAYIWNARGVLIGSINPEAIKTQRTPAHVS